MSSLRPDERAAQAEIERSENLNRKVKFGLSTAATLGAAAVGGPLAARVAPFLNQLIPADLAMKGISKISPKLGEFLKKGQSAGLDIKEGLNFLKSKISPQEEAPEKPSESLDPYQILANYDPKLSEGIRAMVEKGWTPDKANEVAHLKYGAFAKPIAKLEQDKGKSFVNILKELFSPKKSKAALQPQQAQAPQQPGQPQQAQGGGDQALMAAFQKIMQM